MCVVACEQCCSHNCPNQRSGRQDSPGIRFIGVDIPSHVLCDVCFARGAQTSLTGGKPYHRFRAAVREEQSSTGRSAFAIAVREGQMDEKASAHLSGIQAVNILRQRSVARRTKAVPSTVKKDLWDVSSDEEDEADTVNHITLLDAPPPPLPGLYVEWGYRGRLRSSLHLALQVRA